jgi:acyl-[acyl-carrier-protein] desaturase
MAEPLNDLSPKPEDPELLARIYKLFRDFFDKSEKKRRWNMREDIPWDQCNGSLNRAIADVVETFCAVELYLPDYLSKVIPQNRNVRGRAWFFANWGYEESKHSMVLEDWLLKSGHRSEKQMADVHRDVCAHEWDVPHECPRAMACYTMTQELATWLHYNRLQKIIQSQGGDPALDKILTLVSVDERAHFDFFQRLVSLYLEYDREGTLEALRRVVNNFSMPAVHMLADSRMRMEEVKQLRIFDYDIYYSDVYEPLLRKLNLNKQDMRRRSTREIVVMGART